MTVRSYRDLIVWQKSMVLAADVYWLTREFPKHEEYRISGQMIRAATSIPANIAEGHGRGTRKDYAHFVSIAKGSVAELETFLLLAIDLMLSKKEHITPVLDLAEEVGRMLNALRRRLNERGPGDTSAAPQHLNPRAQNL
ncbi:four helix bundle protein [Brevundimonas sp. GCM10030266]|uniref:four helix bundle protein n=1 Tax=Brevundimonas sp. GCM10030266 TaxID=3273386 RepID=UPI00360C306F